ncbi:hypothetical protein PMAYCL1PPCAC_12956, partial [Pristionchus mayeri]
GCISRHAWSILQEGQSKAETLHRNDCRERAHLPFHNNCDGSVELVRCMIHQIYVLLHFVPMPRCLPLLRDSQLHPSRSSQTRW